MIDLQPTPIPASIDRLVARVRRRLGAQAALENATRATIVAVAATLCILWLWRMEIVSSRGALTALCAFAAGIGLAALGALLGKLPVETLAARIDRASGLSDRLGTAVDFSRRLRHDGTEQHPDTLAFMKAAIADGIAATPRANVKAASPWRVPRDLGALGVFTIITIIVALLAFGPGRDAKAVAVVIPPRPDADRPQEELLAPDDLEYQRELVTDLQKLAEETQDQDLQQLAQDLKALLDKAEKGEVGKQDLLTQMDALEKNYMKGSSVSSTSVIAQLKDQGKELKKNPLTKRLGEALETGDLEAAQKELERLGDQIEKGEMKKEDQQKLADSLQQAADKQEQQQKKEEQAADQQIEKKKDEIRTLQKKVEQEPKNEEQKRTLQKEQRELEKLERDKKEEKEDQPKRQLERLSRDLQKSAESLRQKNQKESAQNMKSAAQNAQKMQNQLKKQQNQQKVQSKLGELKEAIRRAKPQKGNGQGREQSARNERIRDFERRAGGGRGNPQAWRQQQGQGSKDGQLGQGQQGQQPGQPGQSGQQGQNGPQGAEQGGLHWGTGHDPNLQGDPTHLDAKTTEEQLTGVQGKNGESRKQTVITAAKKGFATTSYKNVYAKYQDIVEEVMNQEKVPQGYKYYVKRYFQRIKPHSMDD